MLIETLSTPLAVTNPGGNVTGSTLPVRSPQLPMPSGDGVLTFGHGGVLSSSALRLVPLGVGADATTFMMAVYGWAALPGSQGPLGLANGLNLWVPVLLATFTGCTLDSTLPGVANTEEGTTALFCSAMTLGIGNSGVSVEVVSPGHANHQIAHAVVDSKGFRFLQVDFSTGGSATSCNALWSKM